MELLGSHELAHIFAQLTNPADMARARAVCHKWRDAISPPCIDGTPLADVLCLAPNEILETACPHVNLSHHITRHGVIDRTVMRKPRLYSLIIFL